MSGDMSQDRGCVVVGIDGSVGATHALRWALAEAGLRQSKVRAVAAWSPPLHFSTLAAALEHDDTELYRDAAEQHLMSALKTALEDSDVTGVDVEPAVERGYPPNVLCEVAQRDGGAAMLVVGRRGRGGFRGLLLGSVSQRCAATCSVPVVVVPANCRMPNNDDVVVGVDGSPGSRAALRFAVEEAAIRSARLAVVHTYTTPFAVPPAGLAIKPQDRDVFIRDSRALLHEMYDDVAAQVTELPKDVDLVQIEEAAAPGLLTRAADAGLLVVGSRGRGPMAGVLLGSVSQQCLHHAPSAVAVVPAPTTDRVSK